MKRFAVLLLLFAASFVGAAQNALLLEGAVVIDGVASRPLKNSVIVIENGTITGFGPRNTVIVPKGAQRIDLKGKYVIPGLIDGLVEAPSPKDLLRMLAWGVTSVSAVYPTVDEALAAERLSALDTARTPQIYAMAPVFTAPGGWTAGAGADTTINRFPSTPEEARAAIRALRYRGIKRVRIVYDDLSWRTEAMPRLGRDVLAALLEEAAKQKIFTSVQAPRVADAREAVDAGALSIAPGIFDDYVDASLIETFLTRNDYYVPALSSSAFLAEPSAFMARVFADKRFRTSYPASVVKAWSAAPAWKDLAAAAPRAAGLRAKLPTLRGNLETAVKNYVLIVLGTNFPQLPGIAVHLELEEMVRAGMLTYQALIAGTTFGGQYLGLPKRLGTIETGRMADLVVLDADPAVDVRNTRSIAMVVKHGRIFKPKDLLKAANQ